MHCHHGLTKGPDVGVSVQRAHLNASNDTERVVLASRGIGVVGHDRLEPLLFGTLDGLVHLGKSAGAIGGERVVEPVRDLCVSGVVLRGRADRKALFDAAMTEFHVLPDIGKERVVAGHRCRKGAGHEARCDGCRW